MNIYAISWVMASHIDSHVKALFSQNSHLTIKGFVFPTVKVPKLYGVPIYSYDNFIFDTSAVYVDFSFDQNIDNPQKNLLIEKGVHLIGINEWLNLLASESHCEHPFLLDGLQLTEIKNIFIDKNLLSLIEPISRQLLTKLLLNFRSLELRSLHQLNVQTYESFIYESASKIASTIFGGDIQVFNYTSDDFISDISKVCFGLEEFRTLRIYQNQNLQYSINGRDKGSSNTTIAFTSSNDLSINIKSIDSDNFYVVILLNRGLLDIQNSLDFLTKFDPLFFDIKFYQISSKINDAYLVCQFSNNYIYNKN
jgi:hypothetical protein